MPILCLRALWLKMTKKSKNNFLNNLKKIKSKFLIIKITQPQQRIQINNLNRHPPNT